MLRRRRSLVGFLALALTLLSIAFVACGPADGGGDGGNDGGKKDGGDGPPISGSP